MYILKRNKHFVDDKLFLWFGPDTKIIYSESVIFVMMLFSVVPLATGGIDHASSDIFFLENHRSEDSPSELFRLFRGGMRYPESSKLYLICAG